MTKGLVQFVCCLGISLILSSTQVHSQETLNEAAREPFNRGMAAVQQQDWALARRYFLEAYKKESAPQISFNLGLVSTKMPGHELRAIAWFKAYLVAAPNAANAPAVREQITALEVKLESVIGKIATELASKLTAALAGIDGYSVHHKDDFAARLVHIQALLGDTTAARGSLSKHKFETSYVGNARWADLATAFARSGDIDTARTLIQTKIQDEGEKAPAYNAIVERHLRDGKIADAIATAESIKARFARGSTRSRGMWPSQARAFARIACELGHRGEKSRAREFFKRAEGATQVAEELAVIKSIASHFVDPALADDSAGLVQGMQLQALDCPLTKRAAESGSIYYYKEPYENFAGAGVKVLIGDYNPSYSTGKAFEGVQYNQLGFSQTSYDETELQKFLTELAQRSQHPFVTFKISSEVLERFLVTWRERLQ
jgi:tetratricopeptide (TPR) repeat protein